MFLQGTLGAEKFAIAVGLIVFVGASVGLAVSERTELVGGFPNQLVSD